MKGVWEEVGVRAATNTCHARKKGKKNKEKGPSDSDSM